MILHAVERQGSGAAADKPPIVLLHGLFGQAMNFGAVQRRLAGSGRRVIALDMRNHGASPHAPVMGYRAMAEDVLETLRAMQALPAVLVGHSMGGKVAMTTALEAPAAVARLLAADIAPVAYPDHAGGHAKFIAAMQAIPLHPSLTRAEADTALAEVVPVPATRGFLLQNLRFGAQPAWRLNLSAIATALPWLVGWPEFDASYAGPALFLSGARSHYVLPEHRPAIRALFPAARFVALKDAGHWIHADDPDGFVSVVEAFAG